MAVGRVAARHTYKNLVTGDFTLTIASGLPLQVFGMLLTPGAGDTTFTIKNAEGTTIAVLLIDAGTAGAVNSMELTTHWLADKGVSVTSNVTDSHVTVFHGNPGN
jgi:S-adenosylmethionine/arginine decarboxylase-like enzyme